MLITADEIVTGTEVLRPGWVEVSDGAVTGLGAGPAPYPPDVALGAATVVPGFVDMHVHGGGAGAFPEATESDTLASVNLHRRHGTTTMVASLVAAHPQDLLRQVSVLAEHTRDGLVAGLHLEGPWLSSLRCGAHEPSALRSPDPAEIDTLLAAGRGTIRMVTIAPELDGALPAIRRFVDAGTVVAVGHTDATYDQARAAVLAGARVATHLFNAMRPIHHREPGPVVALMEHPEVTLEMITDGVHLHPALYREVTARVGPDRVALITDAMAAAGMTDGAYRLGRLAVEVREGIARVAGSDTIAGSTATMDQVFRFAVEHGGPDRDETLLLAVRQSCLNPARALGLDRGLGLVAGGLDIGSVADLVVLDGDLQVSRVLQRGDWLEPATVTAT